MTSHKFFALLWQASGETFYVVSLSAIFAALLGIPLGIILLITSRGQIKKNRPLNAALSLVINAARSVPFIIFMVAIIPLTRLIVGTSIGPHAVSVPLTLAAAFFMARLTENALREVPMALIETAQAFGATTLQVICRVLIPEALPGLIQAATVMVITLIGYSAMAGAVGGGGLGDLGIRYGYQRYQWEIMVATVALLMIAVQATQMLGDYLTRRFDKRQSP